MMSMSNLVELAVKTNGPNCPIKHVNFHTDFSNIDPKTRYIDSSKALLEFIERGYPVSLVSHINWLLQRTKELYT